jgi:pimeloyl-ACP methyl ester carboxylesterase
MSVSRNSISLRHDDVGGAVLAQPKVADESALRAAHHLVLLIHGYNNNFSEAVKAYNGFHACQHDQDKEEHYGSGRNFVELYWPGDAAWGIASFFFYMRSIDRARESAAVLGSYLAECFQNAQVRIDIVAHSMGGRLALELLRSLANHPQLQVARIVFMAAAVPTFMLKNTAPPSRLRPGYDAVIHEGARSLYSSSDMVLALAFPLGQTLAGEGEGIVPTALGHQYWVSSSVPLNLGQAENAGAGHGDYWGWNTKPRNLSCAQMAAREVRDYLRFASAGVRNVAERPLMESSSLEARKIAERREIAARTVLIYGW